MSGTTATRLPLLAVGAMCVIVVASNFLVQYPFRPFGLADFATWATFSYPVAFLVTDLTNRRFGPAVARRVVIAGFVLAVIVSVYVASPRIALASGSAFLIAQLLDVSVFDRLRRGLWWRAPLVSSIIGSAVDTAIFFTLAFASAFAVLGATAPYPAEIIPAFGGLAGEMPRWAVWGISDFAVKVAMGLAMLVPYGALRGLVRPLHGTAQSA